MLFCFFKVCLTIRWSYKGGIFFFAFVVCAFSLLCSTEHCFLSLLGSRVLRKCLQLQLSPEICVTEGSLTTLRIWMTYVFSLFAFWYIFRGLCCQSLNIWFSAYPNLFWMQSCRKADRIESQVLDFQHIWGTINGVKASISHRMGGRLAEVLLSLSPSIEFSVPIRDLPTTEDFSCMLVIIQSSSFKIHGVKMISVYRRAVDCIYNNGENRKAFI